MMDNRPRAHNSTLRVPRKPMNKLNKDRVKRLRAKQFGTDGKREWIVGMLCGVTGQVGTAEYPIDACHVGSPDPDERGQASRGAGADDTYLFPMRREVHAAFDSLDAAKWEEVFGVSKQWVREFAAHLDREWVELCRAALTSDSEE